MDGAGLVGTVLLVGAGGEDRGRGHPKAWGAWLPHCLSRWKPLVCPKLATGGEKRATRLCSRSCSLP